MMLNIASASISRGGIDWKWEGMMPGSENGQEMLTTLTADIVSAHVANNAVAVSDVPSLISSVYSALAALNGSAKTAEVAPTPIVSIRASIKPSHLICLDCGAQLKMLKRHLNTHHGLSEEQYRARWNPPKERA